MRALKYILSIIIAIALIVGVLIYALGENKKGTGPSGSPGTESSSVVINEFMASNSSFLPDDRGNYSDWIELYNPTGRDVSLSGLGLSDDKTTIKWSLPNVSLAAGGHLVVFASGKDVKDPSGALHSNFKLNASSGGVYLMSAAGQVLDSAEYKDQTENISLGRDAQDMSTWKAFDKPTPGFSNDEAGYTAFLESRIAKDSHLLITEVMPSNKTTIADNTGVYSDYVEIYNSGSEAVNLSGYGLSDDPADVLGWRFPDVTIEPGAYLYVFASGADKNGTDMEKGAIHTNFRISSYQETIVLSNPMGLLIDQVSVAELGADQAYARVADENGAYGDAWESTSQPTPGYANTNEGYTRFLEANPIALGPVVISEVMSSNSQYLQEEDGEYYDWIELCNQSDQPVDISGYGLTDNAGNPAKWRLPQMTLNPGQYITVLASGAAGNEEIKKNYIHTNFKLSADGEVLALFDANGVLQDKYNLSYLPYGVSVGRMQGQNPLFYFEKPTPGTANSNPLEGVAATPKTTVAAGSYDGAQTVALECDTPNAKIYYTLDGTEPTTSSSQYSGPVTVSKTGMIRARAYRDGFLPSVIKTATYFVGEKHTLPLLSIVTNPDYLWNEQTGIYMLGPNPVLVEGSTSHYEVANYLERGKESERPASFEVFDENGQAVFSQNVGIRIAGGYSRDNKQKAFAIMARSKFGGGSLPYAFFDNRPFTEYQSLVLRQGGQDQTIGKIKELVTLSLVQDKGFNFLTQAWKPYVLYLNGEYWGVYFMMEKRNENFIAQHENFSNPDNINVMWSTSRLIQGDASGYKALMTYIESHDMSVKENYEHVAAQVDTDSFMDLMINQIWVANSDYANIQYYQLLPDGKWKQIYYDFCWTFGSSEFPNGDHPTLAKRMDSTKAGSTLFNGLLKYKPWRDAFIERFAWALKEVYAPSRVIETIDTIAEMVRSEMPAEREKFGGTMQGWEKTLENMKIFAKKRGANVVQQLKNTFSLSSEQKNMLDNAIKYSE